MTEKPYNQMLDQVQVSGLTRICLSVHSSEPLPSECGQVAQCLWFKRRGRTWKHIKDSIWVAWLQMCGRFLFLLMSVIFFPTNLILVKKTKTTLQSSRRSKLTFTFASFTHSPSVICHDLTHSLSTQDSETVMTVLPFIHPAKLHNDSYIFWRRCECASL